MISQFFHGVQFVYEAKYLTKYNIPPLKVVGLEGKSYKILLTILFSNLDFRCNFSLSGINGALTLCVLLWPAYFLQDIPYFGVGPNKR